MAIDNSTKPEKTSLVLPIFLMVVPIILIIACFILCAVFDMTISNSVIDSSKQVDCSLPITETTILADAVRCGRSNDAPVQLFSESSQLLLVIKIFTFGIGGLSLVAFLPCMIVGIKILPKRLKARKKKL